jgi:hypothetical protein
MLRSSLAAATTASFSLRVAGIGNPEMGWASQEHLVQSSQADYSTTGEDLLGRLRLARRLV